LYVCAAAWFEFTKTSSQQENSATLSGAGVGLNWVGPRGWALSGSLAAPIGRAPILTGDTASSRLWIEIHKAFSASAVSR
jgi:hypothetical protein